MDYNKYETHDIGAMVIYCLPTHSANYKADSPPWLVLTITKLAAFLWMQAAILKPLWLRGLGLWRNNPPPPHESLSAGYL